MFLSTSDLTELAQLATKAAQQAGQIVIDKSQSSLDISKKEAGESQASQVVTEVDFLSQKIILDILEPSCNQFDLALLTEELPDNNQRFEKDYFWCVDPLDGTLPFIESKPGYAVSIALVSRDGVPIIGIIFGPKERVLYQAIQGSGAFRNGKPFKIKSKIPCPEQKLMFISDRSFAQQAFYKDIKKEMERISFEQGYGGVITRTQGGAVMNACWVLEHKPACYFKFPKVQKGGGCLWDYAATTCLFHEAGGIATDIKGIPLDLNRSDSLFLNHQGVIFCSDADLADAVKKLYKRYADESAFD